MGCRFSSRGSPGPGTEPEAPALTRVLSCTEPPGKPSERPAACKPTSSPVLSSALGPGSDQQEEQTSDPPGPAAAKRHPAASSALPCPFCPQPTGQTQGAELKLLLRFLFLLKRGSPGSAAALICGSPAVGSDIESHVESGLGGGKGSVRAEVGKWRGRRGPGRASGSCRTVPVAPGRLSASPLRCCCAFCTQGLSINPLTWARHTAPTPCSQVTPSYRCVTSLHNTPLFEPNLPH